MSPDRRGPLVVAHRGASASRPEHTLAAYELALAEGADGLECDVRLTRDGHLVCVHDRRVAVADGGHRDPGTEVDQRVAVHVDDDATTGGGHIDRQGGAHAAGHRGQLLGLQRNRFRARNGGGEHPALGDLRGGLVDRGHNFSCPGGPMGKP